MYYTELTNRIFITFLIVFCQKNYYEILNIQLHYVAYKLNGLNKATNIFTSKKTFNYSFQII